MSEEGARCTQMENPREACEVLLAEIQSLSSNVTEKLVHRLQDDPVEISG